MAPAIHAVASYEEALGLYRGDLCPGGSDLMVLIERERLRALNLGILTQLASQSSTRRLFDFAGKS